MILLPIGAVFSFKFFFGSVSIMLDITWPLLRQILAQPAIITSLLNFFFFKRKTGLHKDYPAIKIKLRKAGNKQ